MHGQKRLVYSDQDRRSKDDISSRVSMYAIYHFNPPPYDGPKSEVDVTVPVSRVSLPPVSAPDATRLRQGRLPSTSVSQTKTVQNDDFCDDFRAAFPHLLRFGEKNRRSHFPPQNVVYMQKGIKIGPVVWPLTLSFSQPETQPASHGYSCINR